MGIPATGYRQPSIVVDEFPKQIYEFPQRESSPRPPSRNVIEFPKKYMNFPKSYDKKYPSSIIYYSSSSPCCPCNNIHVTKKCPGKAINETETEQPYKSGTKGRPALLLEENVLWIEESPNAAAGCNHSQIGFLEHIRRPGLSTKVQRKSGEAAGSISWIPWYSLYLRYARIAC